MREFDHSRLKELQQRPCAHLFEKSPGRFLNVPGGANRRFAQPGIGNRRHVPLASLRQVYHFLVESARRKPATDWKHHQSSDEQVPELGMVSSSFVRGSGGEFAWAHEMIHSWNGKFQAAPPALATPDYQQTHDRRHAVGL